MNILNNEGHNPLHKATIEGKDKFFHGLLDAGALPSVPSDSGRLPHLVLKHANSDDKRRVDLLEKVLSYSEKEINACDKKHGGTPLHWSRTKVFFIRDLVHILTFKF